MSTVLIQIRINILFVLILVQTVYKDYKQANKLLIAREESNSIY